jgi:hypothetical protein
MADDFDGERIARELIANEARRKTGSLDLGDLGLTELPAELWELTHLRRLNLGGRFPSKFVKWFRPDPDTVDEARNNRGSRNS